MAKVYFDEYGNPNPLPVGVEQAKKSQSPKYISLTPCPVCGLKVFFTKNGKCLTCARHDSTDLYAFAVGAMKFIDIPPEYNNGTPATSTGYAPRGGLIAVGNRDVTFDYKARIHELRDMFPEVVPTSPAQARAQGHTLWLRSEPCAKAGHMGIRTIQGECYFCAEDRLKKSARKQAQINGDRFYMPEKPCNACGKIAQKRTSDGYCLGCNPPKPESPRQIAIREGKATYIPTHACPHCNQKAEKRVTNGQCLGCLAKRPAKDNTSTSPDSIMMKAQPDLIISRDEARMLGMKVYRHGRPCKQGHTGFRYVSTNSCIDCKKGKPPEVTP